MCVKCKNRVFFDPETQSMYYIDDSCNKVKLPFGATAGNATVDDWIGQGAPPLPEPVPSAHDNPFYQTQDSLKCAKATAIVNEIWNVLTIGEAFRTAETISAAAAAVTGMLTPFKWQVGAGLGVANAIWGALTGTGFGEYADEMETVYENTEAKNDLICDLVDRMIAPVKLGGVFLVNRMTSEDVKVALERFTALVPHDPVVRKTLGAFPIQGWIDVVQFKVIETECGCEDYLPYEPAPTIDDYPEPSTPGYWLSPTRTLAGSKGSGGGWHGIGEIITLPYKTVGILIEVSNKSGDGNISAQSVGADTGYNPSGSEYDAQAFISNSSSQNGAINYAWYDSTTHPNVLTQIDPLIAPDGTYMGLSAMAAGINAGQRLSVSWLYGWNTSGSWLIKYRLIHQKV
jgi:hypothetical protein